MGGTVGDKVSESVRRYRALPNGNGSGAGNRPAPYPGPGPKTARVLALLSDGVARTAREVDGALGWKPGAASGLVGDTTRRGWTTLAWVVLPSGHHAGLYRLTAAGRRALAGSKAEGGRS